MIFAAALLALATVGVEWREVEPAEGRYTFAAIDRQLEAAEQQHRKVLVEVLGNQHPEWMYSRVPFLEKKLAYWHPVYRQAYRRMLAALAQHLNGSPQHETVIGMRIHFNAIDSDRTEVSEPDRAPEKWTVPQSTPVAEPWTRAVEEDYRREVIDNYIESFTPAMKVFLRSDLAKGNEGYCSSGQAVCDESR